jgi:hypothetical protein
MPSHSPTNEPNRPSASSGGDREPLKISGPEIARAVDDVYEHLAAVLIDPFQRLEHLCSAERSYQAGTRRVDPAQLHAACEHGIEVLEPEEVEIVLRDDREALDALIQASGRWFRDAKLPTLEELERAPAPPPLPPEEL